GWREAAVAGDSRRVPELQRRAGQGRGGRRSWPPLPKLEGETRSIRRQEADRDRRAVRRSQGASGRLLAVAGALNGRSRRVAEACTLRWRDLRDPRDFPDRGGPLAITGGPPFFRAQTSEQRPYLARHELDRRRSRLRRQHAVEDISSVAPVFGPIGSIDRIVDIAVGVNERSVLLE